MEKMSSGIIYAVKLSNGDNYNSIANFMSNYTNTPIEYYTKPIIKNILTQAIVDLLESLEHPGSFFANYQRWKDYPWNMDDFEAMCAALSEVQVKRLNYNTNKYEYINGFCPVEGFKTND